MTSKQENKLSMYLAVKAVCDRNTSTWQSLPAFADACADFSTRLITIQALSQAQAVPTTGLTQDKKQLRKDMALVAAEVGIATHAYAQKIKSKDLAAKTDVSVSTFTRGRDTLAPDLARNIHAAATAALPALAPYGVTASKLAGLKARVDAYAAALSKPRDAAVDASTATERMKAEFAAADAALKDQMDALVAQFAAGNPKFVADYKNARVIVDATGGAGKKPGGTGVPPTTTTV